MIRIIAGSRQWIKEYASADWQRLFVRPIREPLKQSTSLQYTRGSATLPSFIDDPDACARSAYAFLWIRTVKRMPQKTGLRIAPLAHLPPASPGELKPAPSYAQGPALLLKSIIYKTDTSYPSY